MEGGGQRRKNTPTQTMIGSNTDPLQEKTLIMTMTMNQFFSAWALSSFSCETILLEFVSDLDARILKKLKRQKDLARFNIIGGADPLWFEIECQIIEARAIRNLLLEGIRNNHVTTTSLSKKVSMLRTGICDQKPAGYPEVGPPLDGTRPESIVGKTGELREES